MSDFTTAELLACVERELKRRKRYYPARRLTGSMKQHEIAREIAMMEAIAEKLRQDEKELPF